MLKLDLNGVTVMSNIMDFTHIDFGKVRSVVINNEPWFVGRDIAIALGYSKPENALIAHVDNDDKTTTLIQGSGSNYKSKTVIINESGLYSLIFGSKLKTAKKFKKWVTREVLPAIRQFGVYIDPTHPNIRRLSIGVRKDCASAINSLAQYASCADHRMNTDKIYGILTTIANELAGIETGQRDKADSEHLIKLIRIETSFIKTIYKGILYGNSCIEIMNYCKTNAQHALEKYDFSIK